MKSKRLVFLLGFLQLVVILTAQDEIKRTHLGFSIVPQITKFHFQSDLGEDDSFVEDNSWKFNYAISGNLFFDIGQKSQLLSGLTFHKMNISYRDHSLFFPDDFVNGMYDPTLSYWIFNYSNYFLGVPLDLKIKLNQRDLKNHFFINGGIRFQYLLGNSGYVQLVETGHEGEERDFDYFYFDENRFWSILTAGFGYEFKLGKGKCFINPMYEYSLTKLYKEDTAIDANGHSTSFGIRLAYY